MSDTVSEAVAISHRRERGYVIFQITGNVDLNIYPNKRGEEGPLSRLGRYVSEIGDSPFALDVRGCRFSGSDSMALFLEAYTACRERAEEKVNIISSDVKLIKILKETRIDQFVTLYNTIDNLPPISFR